MRTAAPARLSTSTPRSQRRSLHPSKLAAGAALISLLTATALLGPWLSPYGYDDQDLRGRLAPPAWMAGGSWAHPLGTDQLGRDILTRIVYGAQVSLAVGATGVVTGALVGMLLGLLTGYAGGWIDSLVMRIADAQLAFPYLLLAIAIVTVIGPSLLVLVTVLGLRTWVIYARTIRGSVLSVRESEYIQMARAVGCSHVRVVGRHILPNVVNPLIVLASVELAQLILTESTLSFLGLGVQPPTPSWGAMLSDARNYLLNAWWLSVFPGAALILAVFAANILGDGLRESLDPKLRLQ